MTNISPTDNFDAFLEEFESDGMRLMGKSTEPLTSEDRLFPDQEKLTKEELRHIVILNYPNWHRYALGYKDAADILVKHLECRTNDNLIYPVLFLYRHFIELFVKALTLKSCCLLGEELPANTFQSHKLEHLWGDCSNKLLRVLSCLTDEDKDELHQINRVILEFREFEKQVEAFRFPVNKDSSPCFDKSIPISILRVREVVWRIYAILDKTLAYLDYEEIQE